MNDLIKKLWPNATPEDIERTEREAAEREQYFGQRPCPEHCGCTEFFDTRDPETVTGGFGVAGCPCDRCNS